ncbi:Glycosyl transferase family 2 [Actinopolymorpha cephalotaxi]|uniref:Glycosyl transferase family 2 n=1 Tax=Actinopolymorpha cephalotaxi TaxID=504797 RepID=A0A1I2TAV7_9ACTN|nr:glycosyltransferase family 2 protein [Actinopolymorpha cephalotaxi]NYH82974.1 glycosyltransferase involved in cell wall biosynthesis [Actinopolymorpha cephalotaxi]SFG61249.1 Glycosyl transferase family 2 [Actinopolymorpha cephalotaxi]
MGSSVTVIIPCHNYGRFLAESVRSSLDQDEIDVHALIIDDASTDDTPRIARKLAAGDSRVSYVRHDHNHGHIATYNEGLDLADTEYTVLGSADDLLARGALRRAVTIMEAEPAVGFVYGVARPFVGPPPQQVDADAPYSYITHAGQEWFASAYLLGRNIPSAPSVVVRSSLQKQLEGYNPDLPHSGDLERWLRLALHGDVATVLGVDQAFYRLHDTNMHRTKFADHLLGLRQRRAAFESALQHLDSPASTRAQLQRAADRVLVQDTFVLMLRMIRRRQLDRHQAAGLLRYALKPSSSPGRPPVFGGATQVRQAVAMADAVVRWPRRLVRVRMQVRANRRAAPR